MKYSLIIVAYKAPEALARCLLSLEANPPQYSQNEAEIIIVDNSPEAVEVPNHLLRSLLLKYVRVIIVRDGKNRGFAEGCNEGVRESHGKILAFINPDTVVYPEWAERMAGYLDVAGVGAVGPISNFVAGLQHFTYHVNQSGPWEKTAALARKGLKGRGVDTKLLIGFYLMIPRKIWDEVGGMDPAFFLGCDDLDLSIRLRDAGFSLVIASDVFVYHEGHVSFYAAGVESMVHNKRAEKYLLKKLQSKYGEKLPSSTELWGCEILPTQTHGPMTLSVCMIVRDEEENLNELLPQLGFADEIIVVDTDPEKHYPFYQDGFVPETARSFHFPWIDDFSAARNFAQSKCTGDWILWLDADDRVPAKSAALIRAALDFPGPLTADKKCHFSLVVHSLMANGRISTYDQPRLYPNLPEWQWEGRVHESYQPQADRLGIQLVHTTIPIDHTGYRDEALFTQKLNRNLRLLKMDADSPNKYYHMGKTQMTLGDHEAARGWLLAALNKDWGRPLAEGFREQLRFTVALSYYQENAKAVPEMDEWLKDNPKPDALFFRAEREFFQKNYDAAEPLYKEYAEYGAIMDYYGTHRDTLQPAADMRLDMIERIKEGSLALV